MKAFCCMVCCWFLLAFSFAQAPLSGMYKAKNGHLVISARQDSLIITGQSDQLLIVLNCASAEMSAQIEINTITTGIERFDTLLNSSNSKVFFVGKMGIDLIRTEGTPPLQFDIAGELTMNAISRPMIIKASLDRIPDQENAGVLSGNLVISMNDFNLKNTVSGISDLLLIRFTQVLLRRVCE